MPRTTVTIVRIRIRIPITTAELSERISTVRSELGHPNGRRLDFARLRRRRGCCLSRSRGNRTQWPVTGCRGAFVSPGWREGRRQSGEQGQADSQGRLCLPYESDGNSGRKPCVTWRAQLFHRSLQKSATDETRTKHGFKPLLVKSVFHPCSIRGFLNPLVMSAST